MKAQILKPARGKARYTGQYEEQTLGSNDNWKDAQRSEIEAAQLAPNHDEESAIVETLAPGAYTAVVRGSGRTTGVGLVEVYNIP
jgi:hypothetical protein